MNRENPFLISIKGTGRVAAEFTSVSYKLQINGEGTTGPEAKEKARPVMDKVKALAQEWAERAGINRERIETSFSVSERQALNADRTAHVFAGYRATFSMKFEGSNVAAATDFHDALTSVDGAQVSTPVFNVKGSVEVEERAFAAAVTNARDRFAKQCKALELTPDHYEIATWRIEEVQRHAGKTLMLTEDALAKLTPGNTEYSVDVVVTFTLKLPL